VNVGATTVEALAHAYHFVPAGESEPDCYKKFTVLRQLARWAPSGESGASLDLLNAAGKEIGHFSPVQDTSVYLRGRVGGKIYEMRDPAE
jgi:hypothetical protein